MRWRRRHRLRRRFVKLRGLRTRTRDGRFRNVSGCSLSSREAIIRSIARFLAHSNHPLTNSLLHCLFCVSQVRIKGRDYQVMDVIT